MSRRLILVGVALVAVLAAGAGWLLGQRIESPAETAARTAPPPASLITVPVELRELSSAVVTRGTVSFDDTTNISVTGSEFGSSIITRVTKTAGEDLLEGDVAIEVAGRPLFVLQGELPIFRSLTPGLDGPDVRQLEEALSRLGYDPGPIDGVFGARTERAVEELYRDAGYSPIEADPNDQAQLDAAQSRVDLAETQLRNAQDQADQAGVPETTRLQVNRAVSQAQNFLASARQDRTATLSSLNENLANAEANQATVLEAARVARIRKREAENTGVDPDTGQPVTAMELQALRSTLLAANQAIAPAAAALDAARTERDAASGPLDDAVDDANFQLRVALASRDEAFELDDGAGGDDLVADAREELADAQEDFAELDGEIGTRFPANELMFLPALPRLVQRVEVEVGDIPQGPVMVVSGADLAITGGVSSADRPLIELGQEVELDDATLGISIRGVIDFIADNPGGPDVASDRYRIRVVPTNEVSEDAYNQNLRMLIPISSTGGEVLAVPLAALSAGADGTSRVEVERTTGDTELVPVRVGLSASGFAQVEATSSSLDVGDRVVVGRDIQTAGDASESSEGEGLPDDNSDPDES